jgi:hypothetical protein
MKQITLTDGRVALVDDDDAEAAIRERYHAEDGLSAHPIEEEEALVSSNGEGASPGECRLPGLLINLKGRLIYGYGYRNNQGRQEQKQTNQYPR